MTDDLNLEGIPSEELDRFLAFRAKVKGTNISERTLLATDYLNHFNEIVMLLEMVPDMPELLDEVKEWEPLGYQTHFEHSSFSDKQLAVEAYEVVPTKFRAPFEETIEQMNHLVEHAIQRMDKVITTGDTELLRATATAASHNLQRLMDVASAIIHGSERTMDQEEIDAMIGF